MKVSINGEPYFKSSKHIKGETEVIIDGQLYSAVQDSASVPLWYLKDDDTFISIVGNSVSRVLTAAAEIAYHNPYGMFCPIKVKVANKTIKQLGSAVIIGDCDLKFCKEKAKEWLEPLLDSKYAELVFKDIF